MEKLTGVGKSKLPISPSDSFEVIDRVSEKNDFGTYWDETRLMKIRVRGNNRKSSHQRGLSRLGTNQVLDSTDVDGRALR